MSYLCPVKMSNLKHILGSKEMQMTDRIRPIINGVCASTYGPDFTSFSIRRKHKRKSSLNAEGKANG